MAVHAAFAEEMSGLKDRDDGFLALFGQDSELDLSFLNVKHSVRDVALRKHNLIFLKFNNSLPHADFGEKYFGIER